MVTSSHLRLRTAGRGLLLAILLVGLVPLSATVLRSGETPGQAAARSPSAVAGPQQVSAQHPSSLLSPSTSFRPPSPAPQLPIPNAYVRDVDLGNGRHQALVSNTPINYQAADGSWQPIDPRFAAVPGGFMNRTNSLVISVGAQQAVLRLRQGETMVGWEPLALALRAAAGEETVLARPLPAVLSLTGTLSADGRTVQYAQGWTWSGLREEVTAGPGQVEQSLVFVSIPSPLGGEGTRQRLGRGEAGSTLTLQATLYLFPGMQLYAGGILRTGPFTTTGPVELRGAQGVEGIVLAPPRAFEQGNPGVGVAGHYHLTPQGEGTWQVAVDTPWAWWTDSRRAYPVVLDPTMEVLDASTGASVYSGGSETCGWYLAPGDYTGQAHPLGRRPECSGVFRTLLRFGNLPTLPPGYQLDGARLLVTPVRGYYAETYDSADAYVDVRPILTPWDPATVTWDRYQVGPTYGAPGFLSVRSPASWSRMGEQTMYYGTFFDLDPAWVDSWLTDPAHNDGLEFRLADESSCAGNKFECQFVEIPYVSGWNDADLADLPPSQQHWWTNGGGVMLLLTYTPPTLPDGVTWGYTQTIAPPSSPAGRPGNDYSMTAHTYKLPASSNAWTVVGAKGLQETTFQTRTILVATGNLAVDLDCTGSCERTSSSGDLAGKPNYLLVRGDPAAQAYQFRVQPPGPQGNEDLSRYLVESRSSTDLPEIFSEEVFRTYTYTLSTNEVFQLLNLQLVEGTRVGVEVHAWSERADIKVGVRLYRPANPGAALAKEASGSIVLPEGARSQTLIVNSGEGGNWALVLENQDNVNPCTAEPYWCSSGPVPFTVTVAVRACPANAWPTPEGCTIMECSAATNSRDVGPYRIYSRAGFDGSASNWTTRMRAQDNNKLYAPCIGWNSPAGLDRLVVVANGYLAGNTEGTPELIGYDNTPTARADVALATFAGGYADSAFQVWQGPFAGYPNPGDPDYGWLKPQGGTTYFHLPLGETDKSGVQVGIDVSGQYELGQVGLSRDVETLPGTPFAFSLSWQVQAEGVVQPLTFALQSGPDQADVGSLTLHFGSPWSIDLDTANYPAPGRFATIRNQGRIVQPDLLGGAWKPIQALILPRGQGLPGPGGQTLECAGYCLDPRAPDDSLGHVNRQWEMPDVQVSGAARTIIYNRPGEVAVFSSDHPDALDDVTVPFSFNLFKAQVKVSKGTCDGTPGATIVEGQGQVALPGLGSLTRDDQMIAVKTFRLCQGKLREVAIEFSGPEPGIPVGSTGFFVDSLSGKITIDPYHTEVKLETVAYQSGPGGDLVDGTAGVTIDTRGLFDMQTQGTVIRAASYGGHVWVAWNPLDVGVDVRVWYPPDPGKWKLWGQVRGHMWQGRGWQGRYYWLPDNSDMHFTASIDAGFWVQKGAAFSWWFINIPPMDLDFSIWIAFGEFCIEGCGGCGAGCYEWGFKGGFTVIGCDVGFYYGFNSGIDFILGSDGHALVDQYGGVADQETSAAGAGVSAVPLVAGRPARLHRVAMPDPLAAEATYPITITGYTGSAIVALAWQDTAGSPALTLRTPTGLVISPSNALEYGITVSEEQAARTYFIPAGALSGRVGIWHADIANAAPADLYHLVFFANKRAPDVDLLTPASPNEPGSMTTPYTIRWTANDPLPPDVDLRISLYYTATHAGELTPTQNYGGVIIENLPLGDGQYDWDMSFLATGTYSVYAKLADGSDALRQPRPTITGTNQIPTVLKIDAPGSISLVDTAGPVAPTGIEMIPMDEAFMVCWDPNPEHDLAGYLLGYYAADWQGNPVLHYLRVPATVPSPPPPDQTRQCARIGGLNAGDKVLLQAAAYDASGNLGYGSWPMISATVSAGVPDAPPAPGTLDAYLYSDHSIELFWTGVVTPGLVSGYYLYYAQEQPAGPGQPGSGATAGPAPVDVGNVTGYTLYGLEPGHIYSFIVQAYDSYRRVGPLSNLVVTWITDGVDVNPADGIPDDWQAAYQAFDASADPDQDCLDNYWEFWYTTHPHWPDTDGDTFSDGEEAHSLSNPRDPHSIPSDLFRLPRLHLQPRQLVFWLGTGDGDPPPQWIGVEEERGSVLTPTVSATAPWLTLQVVGERVRVAVNQSGLASGHYTGTITVGGISAICTLDSPQTVAVDLWLFQGKVFQYHLYLPLVLRNSP